MNSRQIAKFFGSLKLAVTLLTILTAVLTVATFYESRTSTAAVTAQVYRSWWFNVLLAALGMNLAVAAGLRWPWKQHQVGFVVTHAGLIMILGGCSAAWHFGTEGMMALRVGEPPANNVQLDNRALVVMSPEVTQTALRMDRRGMVHPKEVTLPGGMRLTLEEFYPNAKTEMIIHENAKQWSPAAHILIQSKRAAHDIRQWMFPNQRLFEDLAFVIATDAAHLARLTNAPPADALKEVRLLVTLKEQQLNTPVVGNTGKDLSVPGTDLSVHILNYWPDFRMGAKHEIVSISEEPNNPVALVLLTRGENSEKWFLFGSDQMQPMLREQKGTPIGAQLQLRAPPRPTQLTLTALANSADLYFVMQTRTEFKSGPVAIGQPLALRWMDAQLTVERFLTNAVAGEQVVRAPDHPEQSQPALRVTAHGGASSRPEWLLFGRPVQVRSGNATPIQMVFAWATMPLPFTVTLEDFVVERDEGSHNIAGWTSKVIFTDPASGEQKRADVWMNHPAVFKGYKFSQASWNPQDLKYTVLQVKKDPLWVIVLTWTGSGLTILGIALMFYARRWV